VPVLWGAGYAQHTTNYKLKQLILYLSVCAYSFSIGYSDVLLVE